MQIIGPGTQRPTFGQKLGLGVQKGLDSAKEFMQFQQQQQQQQLQQQAIAQQFPELAGIPQELQKAAIPQLLKGRQGLNPLQQTQQQLAQAKLQALEGQQDLFKRLSGGQQDGMPQEGSREATGLQAAPEEMLHQVAAFKGQPGEAGIVGNMAQAEIDRRKETEQSRSKKESRYFEMNEPKLATISDQERKLDIENARYERMGELFSDPSKFPSGLTAALFSKEGQLRDTAYSQLSPEAQEAVKLIIDSTSNIKDTYGARVTNFDLQTYLRKLPSLLNSPEGRKRVLRDLQSVNEINQLYNRGIQDIFDKAGGTDKIPFSTAEKIFKHQYGPQIKQLLKDFATPEKKNFSEKPNPSKYLGKRIKDAETGEVLISDGKEWKPFEG